MQRYRIRVLNSPKQIPTLVFIGMQNKEGSEVELFQFSINDTLTDNKQGALFRLEEDA